jgi:hypothetical protein
MPQPTLSNLSRMNQTQPAKFRFPTLFRHDSVFGVAKSVAKAISTFIANPHTHTTYVR